MFESWITRPHDRRRLEANTLCRELVLFAQFLESQSYRPGTLRSYLFAAAAFGRWIDRQGLSTGDVEEPRLQAFLAGYPRQRCHGRPRGRLPMAASGVRLFVDRLRACGEMPPPAPVKAPSPIDEIVATFDSHLEHVGGLTVEQRHVS